MRLPRIRLTVRGLIAAVAIVAVIAVPFGFAYREMERARQLHCLSNIGHIGMLLHNHHSGNSFFPTGTIPNAKLPPERRLGWMAQIWQYGGTPPNWNWDRSKGWADSPNWPPIKFGYAHCSTALDTGVPYSLAFIGIAGLGPDAATLPAGHPRCGVFGYDRKTRLDDVTDGPSTTLMLAETNVGLGAWTAGGPSSVRGVDPKKRPHIGPGRSFGGNHASGAAVAMVDGSVKFIRETIHPKVFEAMSTIAGGEQWTAVGDR